MIIHLNDDWHFYSSIESKEYETVRLPHSNVVMPYNCFDESLYQKVSKYENMIYADSAWQDKVVFITFMAIAHEAMVYINDRLVHTNCCGYTSFTVDISKYLEFEKENKITVIADANETLNQPPFGNVIDYMTYGGIYREVYIEVKEKIHISDVFIIGKARRADGLSEFTADIEVVTEAVDYEYEIDLSIYSVKGNTRIFEETYNTKESKIHVSEKIKAENWDLDNPNLYRFVAKLYHDEKLLDEFSDRFGFRDAMFKKDGFYLNGKKVKIIGLNRHQSYPYTGYAMSKRVQINDADILKNELNVNAVRTSHYPQSKHFINRCDELGLLVFTEIPGWQHIGDEKWKEIAVDNVKNMVRQYRNHPSIILWGVRINESADDDDFYTRTNTAAKESDPYRQTGGVRCIKKSSLLEDVYTYNDFTHNGKKHVIAKKKDVTDKNVPYLITEYNGHMYSTKMFDEESHRVEHVLRHARVINAVMGDDGVAGCFGWCMNDYNTHKDFGSGDRICYHGVMDMFRNPKDAAYAYSSQSDKYPVMHIATSMSKGDYPMAMTKSIWAFTNCDYIKMSINGRHIKDFYPDKVRFKDLLHPPIEIDDFTGDILTKDLGFSEYSDKVIKKLLSYIFVNGPENLPIRYMLMMVTVLIKEKLTINKLTQIITSHVAGWGDNVKRYVFEGIKDGKTVVTQIKEPLKQMKLLLLTDTSELKEDETYDTASVRIRAVDQNMNLLNYCNEPLRIVTEGPIKLIGPDNISLKGGCAGVYIRTDKRCGKAVLRVIGNDISTVTKLLVETEFLVSSKKERQIDLS